MQLTFRAACSEDFEAYYAACFGHSEANRSDHTLRSLVHHEWGVFLDNPATLSMLVIDQERPSSPRVVGMAQTVFVSNAFVEYVTSDAPPHPNMRASRPLPDGSWPLLTPIEVERANAEEGVTGYTTRWDWDEALPTAQQQRVRQLMGQAYALFYRGYRYKALLIKATGDWACKALKDAGYNVLTDYADYYRKHPPIPLPFQHPYLLGISREEALSKEGHRISDVFSYTLPRLGLEPHYKELLCLALLNQSDQQAARVIGINLDGVRKRWAVIYERVADTYPDLLPPAAEGRRGAEKRGPLLHYLRDHLEEVRPFFRPRGETAQ